jgi:hypothetical protein
MLSKIREIYHLYYIDTYFDIFKHKVYELEIS